MFGELSERYIACRNLILETNAKGFKIMANTPGLGAYRFEHELKLTSWVDEWPDFVGEKGINTRSTIKSINKGKERIVLQRFEDLIKNRATTKEQLTQNSIQPTP